LITGIAGTSCDSHKMQMVTKAHCAARPGKLFIEIASIILCIDAQGNRLGLF
jgi:hypothetical protein